MIQRIREVPPRLKASLAGVFYFIAVLSAVFAESLVRGRLLYAVGLIPVASFAVVTVLLSQLLKPVNNNLAWLAARSNLFRLMLEAFKWRHRPAQKWKARPGMFLGLEPGVARGAGLGCKRMCTDTRTSAPEARPRVSKLESPAWFLLTVLKVQQWNERCKGPRPGARPPKRRLGLARASAI